MTIEPWMPALNLLLVWSDSWRRMQNSKPYQLLYIIDFGHDLLALVMVVICNNNKKRHTIKKSTIRFRMIYQSFVSRSYLLFETWRFFINSFFYRPVHTKCMSWIINILDLKSGKICGLPIYANGDISTAIVLHFYQWTLQHAFQVMWRHRCCGATRHMFSGLDSPPADWARQAAWLAQATWGDTPCLFTVLQFSSTEKIQRPSIKQQIDIREYPTKNMIFEKTP